MLNEFSDTVVWRLVPVAVAAQRFDAAARWAHWPGRTPSPHFTVPPPRQGPYLAGGNHRGGEPPIMDGYRFPPAVQPWLEAAQAHPEVRAVLLAGGSGRGDLWTGSDLDLYVVWAHEGRPDLPRPNLRDRFADVHHVTVAALEDLIAHAAAFAQSTVVDETAGGVSLHDPDGLLGRWLAVLSARLADPAIWRARARVRLQAARQMLVAADAEDEPIESALLARDAARLVAWAYVVGRGGLITSARRFADRFMADCARQVQQAFAHVWALGGGRSAVDTSVTALQDALRGALDAAVGHPRRADEHYWIATYRGASEDQRQATLAVHPLPALLLPALAAGYYDGALMWMRGYYRLMFTELLAELPPGEWPVAALRRFHGFLGNEREQCRGFLEMVEASVLH